MQQNCYKSDINILQQNIPVIKQFLMGMILVETLTINCQLNGTYDINMEEWSCTKPCPFPSLIDPEIMKHDWTNNITGPEIFQEVKHSCLNGRKLVSKLAFETGVVTTFFDEIMSSCQVS